MREREKGKEKNSLAANGERRNGGYQTSVLLPLSSPGQQMILL